jgi:hypothetical protein
MTGHRWPLLFAFLLGLACAETSPMQDPGPRLPQPVLDDEDLLSMVPAEADLLLFANLAQLRASPWTRETFDKVASTPGNKPTLDQMAGMDRIVLAKLPALRDGASVLIAQGKIDRERVKAGFVDGDDRARDTTYRGADVYERGEEALAFVGRHTVLSGMTVAVRAAIDCNFGIARAIETVSWYHELRARLSKLRGAALPTVALYVHLQPATREVLMAEMGEGGTLEDFAGRIDLDRDLDLTAVGTVRSEQQATDMAARLAERLRELRTRPIVNAFGLGAVVDGVRLSATGSSVKGTLHVAERERAVIAERMKVVADTIANLRKQREQSQEKDKP